MIADKGHRERAMALGLVIGMASHEDREAHLMRPNGTILCELASRLPVYARLSTPLCAGCKAALDRPACPVCETGRLTPREQPDVWDCDTCKTTLCYGELVTCPNCGQTIKWDGDEGHCACEELAKE